MATKIRTTKNDPPTKVVVSSKAIAPSGKVEDRLDVRDIISNFVGSGNIDLTTDDGRGNFARMRSVLGDKAAQKLITQAQLFNQRADLKGMTPEQRVSAFYSSPSSDTEVQEILRQGRGLGYGVAHGLRTSPLFGNFSLTGRSTGGGQGDATAVEKIKLMVRNQSK